MFRPLLVVVVNAAWEFAALIDDIQRRVAWRRFLKDHPDVDWYWTDGT